MARSTTFLALELVALLLGVTFLVQLFQRRMGGDRIRRVMGGPPLLAALKGIGIGFVTPFCTYSAIPMLIGLRQARVPPAGYVAFIVAAPVLDPILFGALAVIVGIKATLLYTVIAFTAALGLAMVAQSIDMERHLKPIERVPVPVGVNTGPDAAPFPASCVPAHVDSAEEPTWDGIVAESRAAWASARNLLKSMLPLLVVGLGVGLAIEMIVDAEAAARLTGDHEFFAIPIAAALGVPLYISTELYVPIADSLREAGVATGTIVALTIAGAGANLPEFVLLSRLAHRRILGIFMGYVFAVAVVGGLVTALVL